MVRGDWGQVFRRVLQLHRVPLLFLEVDQDLIEEQIPIGDPAEAPAFVKAEGAGLELIELCCACGRDLPGIDQLLQFRVHRNWGGNDARPAAPRKPEGGVVSHCPPPSPVEA